MAELVVQKPLQGMRAYRFTVDDTGRTMRLPAESSALVIYNDSPGTTLYVSIGESIPAAPLPADSTIRDTPKILQASESPWSLDVSTKAIGLRASAGQTVVVRVEAYYQQLATKGA